LINYKFFNHFSKSSSVAIPQSVDIECGPNPNPKLLWTMEAACLCAIATHVVAHQLWFYIIGNEYFICF